MQKRSTKILRQCRRLNYQQRLRFLNLPTLAFRRKRGDRIEVYKILTGKYDPALHSILHRNINSTTRGNSLKLCTYRPKYGLCKYTFTVRVISLWNSLPTHVITAVSVNSFKNRLDITAAPQVLNRVCLFPLPPLPFLPLPYPPIPSFPPFPSGVERSQSHLPPHSLSLPSLFPFPGGTTP